MHAARCKRTVGLHTGMTRDDALLHTAAHTCAVVPRLAFTPAPIGRTDSEEGADEGRGPGLGGGPARDSEEARPEIAMLHFLYITTITLASVCVHPPSVSSATTECFAYAEGHYLGHWQNSFIFLDYTTHYSFPLSRMPASIELSIKLVLCLPRTTDFAVSQFPS